MARVAFGGVTVAEPIVVGRKDRERERESREKNKKKIKCIE